MKSTKWYNEQEVKLKALSADMRSEFGEYIYSSEKRYHAARSAALENFTKKMNCFNNYQQQVNTSTQPEAFRQASIKMDYIYEQARLRAERKSQTTKLTTFTTTNINHLSNQYFYDKFYNL